LLFLFGFIAMRQLRINRLITNRVRAFFGRCLPGIPQLPLFGAGSKVFSARERYFGNQQAPAKPASGDRRLGVWLAKQYQRRGTSLSAFAGGNSNGLRPAATHSVETPDLHFPCRTSFQPILSQGYSGQLLNTILLT
jgi:hypothetical protein